MLEQILVFLGVGIFLAGTTAMLMFFGVLFRHNWNHGISFTEFLRDTLWTIRIVPGQAKGVVLYISSIIIGLTILRLTNTSLPTFLGMAIVVIVVFLIIMTITGYFLRKTKEEEKKNKSR